MLGLFLSRIVRNGTLTVFYPNGKQEAFGTGEPRVAIRLHDRRAVWELLLNPDLKLGELYMDGRLTMEQGDVGDLLALLMGNLAQAQPSGLHKLARGFRHLRRRIAQYNPAGRAKAHVAHHYDLSGKLYDLFLERDKQYSCAYFSAPGETLEEAQIGKKRHIAAKLTLTNPGGKVLDIGGAGGGWRSTWRRIAARMFWASRSPRNSSPSRAAAPPKPGWRRPASSSWWITERSAALMIASSPSACSSMSACLITKPSSPKCANFLPMTARCCCTRSAAAMDPAPPIRGLQNIFSPAVMFPRSAK